MPKFFKKPKNISNDQDVENDTDENETKYGNINIERRAYSQHAFEKVYQQEKYIGFQPLEQIKESCRRSCDYNDPKKCFKKQLYNRVPAVKWLKNYRIKEYFLPDLLAGLTVGIMHIPQSES
jgi:hypothetical protein